MHYLHLPCSLLWFQGTWELSKTCGDVRDLASSCPLWVSLPITTSLLLSRNQWEAESICIIKHKVLLDISATFRVKSNTRSIFAHLQHLSLLLTLDMALNHHTYSPHILTCYKHHTQLSLSSYRARTLYANRRFTSPCVFGHCAILIWGDRGMAEGSLQEHSETLYLLLLSPQKLGTSLPHILYPYSLSFSYRKKQNIHKIPGSCFFTGRAT